MCFAAGRDTSAPEVPGVVLEKAFYPHPRRFSTSMSLDGVNNHPRTEVGEICRGVLVAPEEKDAKSQIFNVQKMLCKEATASGDRACCLAGHGR